MQHHQVLGCFEISIQHRSPLIYILRMRLLAMSPTSGQRQVAGQTLYFENPMPSIIFLVLINILVCNLQSGALEGQLFSGNEAPAVPSSAYAVMALPGSTTQCPPYRN